MDGRTETSFGSINEPAHLFESSSNVYWQRQKLGLVPKEGRDKSGRGHKRTRIPVYELNTSDYSYTPSRVRRPTIVSAISRLGCRSPELRTLGLNGMLLFVCNAQDTNTAAAGHCPLHRYCFDSRAV